MTFTLFPAVDIVRGEAVRLVQGEAGSETSYGDPVDAALQWQKQGAHWIHLVDLDAAFSRGENREVIQRVCNAVSLKVELSGGVRDDASLIAALEMGAARVNIGTAALENPAWVEKIIAEYGEKIAVGLDLRGTTLAARGWTRDGGELSEVLQRLNAAGCARYIVTDVQKDGTMRGPNLEMLRHVAENTDAHVVASGGVSSLDDLHSLARMTPRVEGAIIGKALYAEAFTLPEALTAVKDVQ